jgi:hypothetical protein
MNSISIKTGIKNQPQPTAEQLEAVESAKIEKTLKDGVKSAKDFFETYILKDYFVNPTEKQKLIRWYFNEKPLSLRGEKEFPELENYFGVNNVPLKFTEAPKPKTLHHLGFCEGLRREIIQHSMIYKYSLNSEGTENHERK